MLSGPLAHSKDFIVNELAECSSDIFLSIKLILTRPNDWSSRTIDFSNLVFFHSFLDEKFFSYLAKYFFGQKMKIKRKIIFFFINFIISLWYLLLRFGQKTFFDQKIWILDKFKPDNDLGFSRLENVKTHLQAKKVRKWVQHMRSSRAPNSQCEFAIGSNCESEAKANAF